MPEPIIIPSPDPLSLAIDVIQLAGFALEIAGIIPDPFALLFSIFAGKPRELSTLTVIQRLLGAQNPAGILWGVELYKLLRNQDIVLSDSTQAGQAAIGATRAQFKASMTVQLGTFTDAFGNPLYPTADLLAARVNAITNDIELNTTSGTQPVPPELRTPWRDQNGDPNFSWCGNDAIIAAYNANLAFAATVLGLKVPTSEHWALRKTLSDSSLSTLESLGTCGVMSTTTCQPSTSNYCGQFGCEGLPPDHCANPDGNCLCTQRCGAGGILNVATGQCFVATPPPPVCPGGEQLDSALCTGTKTPDPANPGCVTCVPVVNPPPIVCNPPQVNQNGICVTPPPPTPPSTCPAGQFPTNPALASLGGCVPPTVVNPATGCCDPSFHPAPPPPTCPSNETLAPCTAAQVQDPQNPSCCMAAPTPAPNPCDSIATNLMTLVAGLGVEGNLIAALTAAIATGSFSAVGSLLQAESTQLFNEGASIFAAAQALGQCIGVVLNPPPPTCPTGSVPPGPNNTCPSGFTFNVSTECCAPVPPPPAPCPIDQYPAPCLAGDIVMSPTCCHTKIDPPHPYVVRQFQHPAQMLQFADF